MSRGLYGEALIYQALEMYTAMDWPKETWLRNTVAKLSSYRLAATGGVIDQIRALIRSDNEKQACFGLLGIVGFRLDRDKGPMSGFDDELIQLLPTIETLLKQGTTAMVDAACWAVSMLYGSLYNLDLEDRAPSPPHEVLDRLVTEWFKLDDDGSSTITRDDSAVAYAITRLLVRRFKYWSPTISENQKVILRSYLKNAKGSQRKAEGSERMAREAAGLIGAHCGNLFSTEEMRELVGKNTPVEVGEVSNRPLQRRPQSETARRLKSP